MSAAKTDNAGRFEFDGVPPLIYSISFGKDYKEALDKQSNITVGGRIFVFQVKPGEDLKIDAVRVTVSAPPDEDE